MSLRLGVDVGGTNTDAAVVGQSGNVVGFAKAATTPDVITGIKEAISGALCRTKSGNSRKWKYYILLVNVACRLF